MAKDKKIDELGNCIAAGVGRMLQQEYRQRDGQWWLWSLGREVRTLTEEEVAWHVARRHSPFVPGGVTQGSPDWWKDPE